MGISIRRSRDLGSSAITLPAGVINPFAGVSAPEGWLLCFGQTVSRTLYPELFNALNTTYNTGGEAGTDFRLPDMRGRAVAGKDDMGGIAAGRLTSTVLSASNTLGATGGTQTHTLTSAQMPSHNHTNFGALLNIGSGIQFRELTSSPGSNNVSSGDTGGGGAHLNTQPTIVLNYIIKV